jgi:cation diffusion facilitator CzcD-associated flavoprotein CzcO
MSESESARVESCDVCIVGAGVAGLNALFAASRYLSRDQKVILVDRRARLGGMWVDVYSYVRLHQPHPMFTAGNIEWTLRRDRAHLATKREVLDHFRHCVDVIAERVQVDEYFGWDFESQEEVNGIVRATCRAADGRILVVETKRLIKAYGLAVTPNEPLEISSKRVHSVSPDYCDVRAGDIQESKAPVWIIGGGKTAMENGRSPRRSARTAALGRSPDMGAKHALLEEVGAAGYAAGGRETRRHPLCSAGHGHRFAHLYPQALR